MERTRIKVGIKKADGLILAAAGFLVMGFNSILRLYPTNENSFSLFRMPVMNALLPVLNVIQTVALITGCAVLIVLVMSKKASGDFRKKEEVGKQ